MKKQINLFALFAILTIVFAYLSCSKQETSNTKQATRPDILPSNTKEKPLSSFASSQQKKQTQSPSVLSSPTPNVTSYGCGSTFSGDYNGTGYYRYPDNLLDLSSTSPSATVTVTFNSYDVPNRFTVVDANNNTIGTTGWMGYATYAGPWGSSLSTTEQKSISFTRGSITSYKVQAETSTKSNSDSWDAAVGCTIPSTITATYAGVTITYEVSNQLLRFNSISDFNTVLNQLETDYENYNVNYDNQFPSTYTVDQLDSIDDARNFYEFKTVRSCLRI